MPNWSILIKYVLCTLCAVCAIGAASGSTAQVVLDAVPGGLAQIPLAPGWQRPPTAFFGKRRILVRRFADRWAGLIGLPLSMVPGSYLIDVHPANSDDTVIREFTVYPRRRKGHSPMDLPALPAEVLAMELTWRNTLDAKLPLNGPVALPARDIFGRYRIVSESKTGHVNYVLFPITAPVSVKAPDAGLIAALIHSAGGTYIWIDHGMGLYSCVGPIDQTALTVSHPVAAGQTIGQMGPQTGDALTPLYFSVYLNGVAIDPFLVANLERAGAPTGSGG